MDNLEKIAYILLGSLAALYALAILVGMMAAMPWGIIGLMAIVGFGLLFIKVLKERLASKEDDYYAKNVEK